jgi:hypothetical protein
LKGRFSIPTLPNLLGISEQRSGTHAVLDLDVLVIGIGAHASRMEVEIRVGAEPSKRDHRRIR